MALNFTTPGAGTPYKEGQNFSIAGLNGAEYMDVMGIRHCTLPTGDKIKFDFGKNVDKIFA